ncbi:MAG TPA: OmpA family protein, partial [Niastella sp.]|nr:OmpA family protein [Niastella sp.]
SVIQELSNDPDFSKDNKQEAVKAETFQAPTPEMKTQQAQSSKVVKLEFPSNSAQLTQDNVVTIDREIKELLQGFEKAYVRIEGNTDKTGLAKNNDRLSLDRANSVVNYLVNEYHLDRNKFIVIGNGSKKPVAGCEDNQDEACKARNRRTEFQFIWEKPGKAQ